MEGERREGGMREMNLTKDINSSANAYLARVFSDGYLNEQGLPFSSDSHY